MTFDDLKHLDEATHKDFAVLLLLLFLICYSQWMGLYLATMMLLLRDDSRRDEIQLENHTTIVQSASSKSQRLSTDHNAVYHPITSRGGANSGHEDSEGIGLAAEATLAIIIGGISFVFVGLGIVWLFLHIRRRRHAQHIPFEQRKSPAARDHPTSIELDTRTALDNEALREAT
ncbi:hypothetical protein M426DRAFT_89426 [Hypoxylon sp. CI-4A]|nr:hypothetical protein M426DRAFT_89426 [Hypoxylon sp. CI-4A]